MDQIINSDQNSNNYFFLTGFDEVLRAGRNSFTVNPTKYVVPGEDIVLEIYDANENVLPSGEVKPLNARFSEETDTGKIYYANVNSDATFGHGRISIKSVGLNVGNYTGSIAYYNGEAYPVSKSQRLPLIQEPASTPFTKVEVVWTRNVLIDPSKSTNSEVRFFSSPYLEARPEIYLSSQYPTASYALSSGTFSAIAVDPRNNYDGDYDYRFSEPLYQLYLKSGQKFNYMMEGESIRIKNPIVKRFTYNNYTNNQIVYEGPLYTDFIAKIKTVVSEESLILDIPFSTVSDLIDRTNEDSPYAKNNLVDIKGFTVEDDPKKQTVFHKKNFYVLSITDGQFEIFYKNIQPELSASLSSTYRKNLINLEFNNVRTMCGNLSSYKIYAKSLNFPESKTLLCEGRVDADEVIVTNNFKNGLYNSPGKFYNSSQVSKFWIVSGSCTFSHDNSVLINGVKIGHQSNSNFSDYVIFKDYTTSSGRTPQYVSYSLLSSSYWYAKTQAFVNFSDYPTGSYLGITQIPSISLYSLSQENLLSGILHDCNPIKLRRNTLYKFSMDIRIDASNGDDSELYIYYISGNSKKEIGYIGSSFKLGKDQKYTNTFFSLEEKYGTIVLVPIKGNWYISNLSIKPCQNVDYSVDSFSIKVPITPTVPNELYEIEAELYDNQNRLAYGAGSYTFIYNKKFLPLKKSLFVDPAGISYNYISGSGGGTSGSIFIDGGNAYTVTFDGTIEGGNAFTTIYDITSILNGGQA